MIFENISLTNDVDEQVYNLVTSVLQAFHFLVVDDALKFMHMFIRSN